MSKHVGCLICDGGAIGMNPSELREIQTWHDVGHPPRYQVSVSDMKPSDPEDKLNVTSKSSKSGGTEEDTNEHAASHISDSGGKQEEAIDLDSLAITVFLEKLAYVPRMRNEPTATFNISELHSGITALLAEARKDTLQDLIDNSLLVAHRCCGVHIRAVNKLEELRQLTALGGKSDE